MSSDEPLHQRFNEVLYRHLLVDVGPAASTVLFISVHVCCDLRPSM